MKLALALLLAVGAIVLPPTLATVDQIQQRQAQTLRIP